ncbi:MAG TPA: hypothetical protein VML19_13790 [Verrucomicrobiae bacterium]|nr:hypothetical protein [Verrucomicrobiae bacterium]
MGKQFRWFLLLTAPIIMRAQDGSFISLHPLYTSDTVVRNSDFADLWTEDDDSHFFSIAFRIEPDDGDGYDVLMDRKAVGTLHLTRIGKETLADMVFRQDSDFPPPFEVHLIFRFRLEGDTLHIAILGSEGMFPSMEQPGAPRHELLKQESDKTPLVLLTASTAELREFVADCLSKPDSFSSFIDVERAGPKTRAEELNQRSWDVVSGRGGSVEAYQKALEWAQEAIRLIPDNGDYWNTLGAAQYRLDQHSDALTSIAYAAHLRQNTKPEDLAFQAMALHKQGQTAEAAKVLADLQKLLGDECACGDEARLLYLEARELVKRK